MSNQYHSLKNAAAGATGEAITTSTSTSTVHVSAAAWGGQSVQLQVYNSATDSWEGIAEALFTENVDKVIRSGNGQKIRAITTGSGGTMAGVSVFFAPHYN